MYYNYLLTGFRLRDSLGILSVFARRNPRVLEELFVELGPLLGLRAIAFAVVIVRFGDRRIEPRLNL
jgi:hypothetical protein